MRNILKGSSLLRKTRSYFILQIDLMAENQTLRNLLRTLASFIGDGAGGLLPKMGWDLQDFNNFVNKGETDTAWEGYTLRKRAGQGKNEEPEVPTSYSDKFSAQGTQKRPSDVEVNGHATKRQRSGDKGYDNTSNGFSMMMPMQSSSIPASQARSMFPAPPRQDDLFPELLRNANGSSFFIPQSSSAGAQYSSPNSAVDGYPRSFMSPIIMEQPSSTFYEPSASASVPQPHLQRSNETREDDEIEDDTDPKRNEAFKLIKFVLFDMLATPTILKDYHLAITLITLGEIDHIVFRLPFDLPLSRGNCFPTLC